MNDEETQNQIAQQLSNAGLKKGGMVLVHSSLRSLGQVPGGPHTMIQCILQAIGPKGTLLMPALSYKTVTRENPVFDVLNTPSCVGVIPEYFRQMKETIRSVHPTHSVCGVGPLAEELLSIHDLTDTPCGPNSPYRLLHLYNGQILFIGCGLNPNTSMHGVEELVEPPYLFKEKVEYQIKLSSGKSTTYQCRRHDFNGLLQRYDRLETLLNGQELVTGKLLNATIHIVESKPMWEKGLIALKNDPFFFVEKKNTS